MQFSNPTTSVASVIDPVTVSGGTINTVTGNVNGSTGSVAGNVSGNVLGSVAAVTGAVGSVVGSIGGNVTGSVASVVGSVGGSVASVVGAVGSVAGNVAGTVASVLGSVASVTGAVGSVTGNVSGNVVGSVGSVTGSVGSVTGNVSGNVAGTVASVTGNVSGNVVGSVASVSGNVAGSTGSVSGNVAGSVGSVTGNIAGNVTGSVASVTGNVTGNVIGSVTNVTTFVPMPFRDACFWPCASGEPYAPTFGSGAAIYTSGGGYPVVQLNASGAVTEATWPFIPRVSLSGKKNLTVSGVLVYSGNSGVSRNGFGMGHTSGTFNLTANPRRWAFEIVVSGGSQIELDFRYSSGTGAATLVQNIIPVGNVGDVHTWSVQMTDTQLIVTIDGSVVLTVNSAIWPSTVTTVTPQLEGAANGACPSLQVGALQAVWS